MKSCICGEKEAINRYGHNPECPVHRDVTLEEKIRAFEKLPNNWNSYHAPTPSQTAIFIALEALSYLREIDCIPYAVAPSAEGGVGFTFEDSGKFAHAEFLNDCELVFLTDYNRYNDPQRTIWSVIQADDNFEELRQSLDRIKKWMSQ